MRHSGRQSLYSNEINSRGVFFFCVTTSEIPGLSSDLLRLPCFYRSLSIRICPYIPQMNRYISGLSFFFFYYIVVLKLHLTLPCVRGTAPMYPLIRPKVSCRSARRLCLFTFRRFLQTDFCRCTKKEE